MSLDINNPKSLYVSVTDTVGFFAGNGSPNNVEFAGLGSFYIDLASGSWYRKTTASTSKTGWVIISGGGGGSITSADVIHIQTIFSTAVTNVYEAIQVLISAITTNQTDITNILTNITTIEGDITTVEGDITTIQNNQTVLKTFDVALIIDGDGTEIDGGIKGDIHINGLGACTIVGVTLLGHNDSPSAGSITIDIWKCSYADYDDGTTHPVVGDSITASTPPTISTGYKYSDTVLSGWTTNVADGDVLRFNASFVAAFTRCVITLTLAKTLS